MPSGLSWHPDDPSSLRRTQEPPDGLERAIGVDWVGKAVKWGQIDTRSFCHPPMPNPA